jgi:hypothetical protein
MFMFYSTVEWQEVCRRDLERPEWASSLSHHREAAELMKPFKS